MFADAEAYERFMGRWSRLLAPKLVEFAQLPEQGAILDVGCGTGSLAAAIGNSGFGRTVMGIDPSPEYVALANHRNELTDRIKFEVGDAQRLRFAPASFDAALSLLAFNFIPDTQAALGELRRVVKPGGAVSVAVWDYSDGMHMLRIFWDAASQVDPRVGKRDEKHMPLCRPGELAALWRKGEFDDVREEALETSMHFVSFADYWDPFLLGEGPAGSYLGSQTPNVKQNIRQQVKLSLGLTSEDEPFSLNGRAWAVCGCVPA